jgi:hypothetical protein
MPIVNKTLRAIRNFGRVTTARDYKPDQIEVKPEDRLRAWKASVRIGGKWTEVAPQQERGGFGAILFGFDESVERGSLSMRRWKDIEQALLENLNPNPEDEFLTNALQHLHDANFRLALIEATVCLEIVLSQCLIVYLEVKRHFPKRKIESVLSNVGLTSRVGLILDLIFTAEERSKAELDSVLRAIGWRNKIIHGTGHLPFSVPSQEVHDCVFAMLKLALRLAERRERLRIEPEMKEIAREVAMKFNTPEPSIEVLKYHKVKVTFSYLGKAALYFRPKGVPATPPPSPPNEEGLRQIVNDLGLRLRARDGGFEPSKHLSVVFEHNLGQVFASFQNGDWNRPTT